MHVHEKKRELFTLTNLYTDLMLSLISVNPKGYKLLISPMKTTFYKVLMMFQKVCT